MIDGPMAAKRPRAKRAAVPPNALTEAANRAQRDVLRRALVANGWAIRETARALGMISAAGIPQAASVLRLIVKLGLEPEYKAHRAKH